MNCKKVRQIIGQMLDNGTAENESLARGHMKTCKKCADYYNFWLSQKNPAPAKAPAGIRERIMERALAGEMKPARVFNVNPFFGYIVPSAVIASLLMFVSVKIYTARATVPVTFKISYGDARTIALAGDFNDWKSDKIFLVKKGDEWEATVRLKPSRYQYIFVIDGEKFVPDPEAQMYADDGFGQKNSVIDITKV